MGKENERIWKEFQPEQTEARRAYGYLSRLFESWAPQCEPLPDLLGLCTQIDNYVTGLRRDEQEQRTKGEIFITAWVALVDEHERLKADHRRSQELRDHAKTCAVCRAQLMLIETAKAQSPDKDQ